MRVAPRPATLVTLCLIATLLPAVAAGQDDGAAGQPQPEQGAAVVQRVLQGGVADLNVKFVSVGGQQALFVGGSGGFVFDGRLLVGTGVYMRLDRSYGGKNEGCVSSVTLFTIPSRYCHETESRESADLYAGVLVGWHAVRRGRVSVAARGLVGGGQVTIGWDGSGRVVSPAVSGPGGELSTEGLILYDQGYFVFEPEVDVSVIVGSHVMLAGSVGYRMIGHANGLEDQLKGMTASFSVRFF